MTSMKNAGITMADLVKSNPNKEAEQAILNAFDAAKKEQDALLKRAKKLQ